MKSSRFFRSLALLVMMSAAPAILVQAAEAGAAKQEAAKPAAPKLTRAQLDEWLAKPDKVIVLDLRRPDEHQSIGALPVFLSIQLADLEKNLAYIPRDRAVIPVSNHASRAGRAAGVLVKNGLNVVGVVGVQDYEAEGGTLNKIQPPPPKPAAAANATGAQAPTATH